MTFLLAVLVFPLLLAAISLGFGLLAQWAAGFTIPVALLVPLGFAGVVGVSQAMTWRGLTAPLTPAVLVVLALAGVALTWRSTAGRWRARGGGWWWILLAGIGAYLVAVAPVLLSGNVTFPGYLLDTTGSIQLIGAERLISEGNSFTVPDSGGYGLALHGFFGTGYPSGAHTAFAGVGRLTGVELLWLYAPFMASMLGLSALVLGFLARRAELPRPAAAFVGLVAAAPALVYAYMLQGSIKELGVLPVLLLLGALLVLARELVAAGPRGAIPLAIVGAAGWSTIGFAFTPWLALALLGVLALGWGALPRRDIRAQVAAIATRGAVLLGGLLLLALPTFAALRTNLNLTTSVSNSNAAAVADPGNLLRPLLKVQALGVWIGSSHRGDPEHPAATYALIGVVVIALALGLVWLVRRRQWALLAYVGLSVLVWLVLTPRATTWTAAKLLVLLSPVVILVALIGALGYLGARRIEGLVLAGVIALGVLASDADLYHSTTMASSPRFEELRQIGDRFAGAKPTLTPDFDEYTLYLLRDMAPDGPGNSRKVQPFMTLDGQYTGYGHTYDLDALQPEQVDAFGAIVVRRSPFKSRPPGRFALVERGDFYDVWQPSADAKAPLQHLGLGTPEQPAVAPSCRAVSTLAQRGERSGATNLRFVERPANVVAVLKRARLSVTAVPQPDGSIGFAGPGDVVARVRVRDEGRYRLWAVGNASRELAATIDGRPAGAVSNDSGGEGNAMAFDSVALAAGLHVLRIRRAGGGLEPGNAAYSNLRGLALQPVEVERAAPQTVRLADWRTLCGRTLDWIETV